MTTSTRTMIFGLAWAAMAITIWSGSLVMLRLGVTTSLNAYDLTALRFGAAAIILAPVALRQVVWQSRRDLIVFATMVVSFGAPYVLLIALAMTTAPAAAAGALNPGVMAIVSVLLGRVILGDRVGRVRFAGQAVTAAGIVSFTLSDGSVTIGHLILVATGIMWAIYALIVRRTAIPALNATAIVAVGSAVLYVPLYLVVLPKRIFTAPLPDILLQTGFQGVLVSVIAIYAFNRSAELMGRVAGATLPALIPVATLGLGVVVLGESVGPSEVVPAMLVTVGVALVLAGKPALHRLSCRRPQALKNKFSL